MHIRFIRITIMTIVSLTLHVPLQGQSILLRLNSEEGVVNQYMVGLETFMDIPMMPTDGPLMRGRVYQTQTILSSDGKVFELQTKTDSADISMPMLQAMGQTIPDMAGQSQTMKMDTRGRMIELMPSASEGLGLGAGTWFTLELPENPVSPGESWDASINVDVPTGVGGSMTLDMNITYTLVSVSGHIASIDFVGPITMAGSAQGMVMDGTGDLSGTMMFDVGGRRLERSETIINLDMSTAGMMMAMNQSVTMQLLH